MITAYPEPVDPVIADLVAHLNECAKARFYIKLENADGGSGFYCHAPALAAAKRQARAHLRKYPSWETATVWSVHRMLSFERLATIQKRK